MDRHLDGTGRVNHINGGIGLDSQYGARRPRRHRHHSCAVARQRADVRALGDPDAVAVQGRRGQGLQGADGAGAGKASDYHCGAQNITIAEYRIHSNAVRVGANAIARNKSWSYTKNSVKLEDVSHNFGVEVAKDHITWFIDGAPIAKVKSRAAVSDVPMTLRLSLEGDGNDEMNRTRSIYDWQRAWPIALVATSPAVTR